MPVYFLTFLSLCEMPLSNNHPANKNRLSTPFKSDAVFEYLDAALRLLTEDDKSKLLSKVMYACMWRSGPQVIERKGVCVDFGRVPVYHQEQARQAADIHARFEERGLGSDGWAAAAK